MQVKGLREIVLIHDLKKQGLSITAIARKVGCDRKTVRKHLEERGMEAPVCVFHVMAGTDSTG